MNLIKEVSIILLISFLAIGCGSSGGGGNGGDNGNGGNTVPDTTPPTVMSTSPLNEATDIAVNSKITATFSEQMNANTINTSSFIINGVTGTVVYDQGSRTAIFTPSVDLDFDSSYTATITTGAQDSEGNNMASDLIWSFTTGMMPDTTPPTVTSTRPGNGGIDLGVKSKITATFSEEMNAGTINFTTFSLNYLSFFADVTGTVAYDQSSRTAIFSPSKNLNFDTLYTATITTGAQDSAGNSLDSDYTWHFRTVSLEGTTWIGEAPNNNSFPGGTQAMLTFGPAPTFTWEDDDLGTITGEYFISGTQVTVILEYFEPLFAEGDVRATWVATVTGNGNILSGTWDSIVARNNNPFESFQFSAATDFFGVNYTSSATLDAFMQAFYRNWEKEVSMNE